MSTRRERVILTLQDDFSSSMARAAAATAVLNKELRDLDGKSVETDRTTRALNKDIDETGRSARRSAKEVDNLSGRLRILADAAAILGPGAVPVGAVGLAGLSGLASQLGFATIGAGTAVLAFQGFGTTLDAFNKAQLEPTTENLAAARVELERLSPAGQDFLRQIVGLKPAMKELRDLAAEGMFPGLSRGLDGLEDALPRVEAIVSAISTEVGEIGGDIGESLGSERWASFLDFIAREGPSALRDFTTATGNTAHALANLWMASDPINDDFGQWLVDSTADLDQWSEGLSQTEGFQEFLTYLDETGPQVAETLGAMANAVLQIVQAAAPLGGPVLQGLEATADVVSAIADSDLGTPILTGVAALALFNRTMALTATVSRSTFGQIALGQKTAATGFKNMGDRIKAVNVNASGLRRSAGLIAGLTVASTGMADSIGLSNTASLALAGSFAGPWGAAIGGATGGVLDLFNAMRMSSAEMQSYQQRITAMAGPNVAAQLAAVNAELERQRKIFDDPNGPSFDAFGVKIAPFSGFGNEWQNAGEKVKALEVQSAQLQLQLDATTSATKYATSEAGRNAARSERQANALLLVKDASRQVGEQFVRFGDDLADTDVSLDKWIENLRDRAEALSNFATNSLKAQQNGVSISLIEELRKTPEGALRLAELAKALPGDVRAANREWRRNRAAVRENTAAAEELRKKAQEIANKKYQLRFNGIDAAVGKAQTLKQILDGIGVTNLIPPPGSKDWIPDSLNPKKDMWSGGYTGPGGKYEPAGIVHRGEYVFSSEATSGNELMLDGLHRQLRGYAGGGMVGDYIRNDLDLKYPRTLKQWTAALAASTNAIEKERDQRRALIEQADQVRSAIRTNYRSDLFGNQSSSVWLSDADRMKAGTGDVFSTLTGDIANLGALNTATAVLKKKGLDGEALADLLSNASLQQVQAFAGSSPSEVLRYESLYNQREAALTRASNAGAVAAFGPLIRASQEELREMKGMHNEMRELKREFAEKGGKIAYSLKRLGPRRPDRGFGFR